MVQVSSEDYNRLPSCLNYVRSAIDVNPGCKFGPSQQVNVEYIFHIQYDVHLHYSIHFFCPLIH